MTETILKIVLAGAGIFTTERQRYFEKGLYERLGKVDEARAKRFPFYSDKAVKFAEKDLENFMAGYAKELSDNIKKLKEGQNV